MPTGYTADVVNGKIDTFEKFALQCARAFGATIMMRDDPMDAPIPDEFKPGDYNLKRLTETKAELNQLLEMTPVQVEAAMKEEYQAKAAHDQKYLADAIAENDRITVMEAKVEAWEPPTSNHVEMKKFMLKQLRMSRHDINWIENYQKSECLSPREWLQKNIEKAYKAIGYFAGEHEQEIERAKNRTLWVKQLRDSLSMSRSNCESPK